MRCLDSDTSRVDLNLSKPQEIVEDPAALHAALYVVTKAGLGSPTQ